MLDQNAISPYLCIQMCIIFTNIAETLTGQILPDMNCQQDVGLVFVKMCLLYKFIKSLNLYNKPWT